MASPVDTSVKIFLSTMAAAPVMAGTTGAGSGIAVLDAALINGIDPRTLTSLVVSGGVATATFAGGAHAGGFVDAVVLISGVTGSLTALNGEQKVTSFSSTTLTFATAAANGTAAGTISMKVAPLGWSKVFTGTNLAAYKSNDVASSGGFLRVDDTDALSIRVVGYESMTDVNTGTNAYPLNAQIAGGLYWSKSTTANAVVIPWTIIGNSLGFYFMAQRSQGSALTNVGVGIHYFGDIASFKTADPYRGVLAGSTLLSEWAASQGTLAHFFNTSGTYIARLHTGAGTAQLLTTNGAGTLISGTAAVLGPYPSPVDNGLILSPSYGVTGAVGTNGLRGVFPGLLLCPQLITASSFSIGDIINGAGDTAGRHLYAIFTPNTTTIAQDGSSYSFFDITGPWVTPA